MEQKKEILFITDIHQNLEAIKRIDFSAYDEIVCGGDILDPKAPDLERALQIVELLPERTIAVPGNCDTPDELIRAISEGLNSIHLKSHPIDSEISIAGVGFCRSLTIDHKLYREYFIGNRERILEFSRNSKLGFLLNFIGIKVAGEEIEILSAEQALREGQSFINKFRYFDEESVKTFLSSLESLKGGILLSHSPPLGYLDRLDGLPHAGSSCLAEGIDRLQPSLVLCGHFHELRGALKDEKGTIYFNPGALNENRAGLISYSEGQYKVEEITI